MDFSQLAIAGLPLAPIIFGLVQIAKDLGWVKGQQARVLALVLGAVGTGAYALVQTHPEYGTAVGVVFMILAGGLGATAIYDLSDKAPEPDFPVTPGDPGTPEANRPESSNR